MCHQLFDERMPVGSGVAAVKAGSEEMTPETDVGPEGDGGEAATVLAGFPPSTLGSAVKDAPGEGKMMEVTLEVPAVEELPWCLPESARHELERRRRIEAEMCLRAAQRHVEVTRWGHYDAAWKTVEDQVAGPFEMLVAAHQAHVEEGGQAFLYDEEEDAMRDYARQARAFRKAQLWPQWPEAEVHYLATLMQTFHNGLAARPVVRSRRGEEETEDYGPVVRAVMKDLGRGAAGPQGAC